MAQQQLSFSQNIYFTSLVSPPDQIQPDTLIWEIDNDPTLAAANIQVRGGDMQYITLPADPIGDGPDAVVTFELVENGVGPISWPELTQALKDALLAVFAAHQGIPTTSEVQSVVSLPVQVQDNSGYATALLLTTEPLKAGRYTIQATFQNQLLNPPATLGSDRSQVQLQVNGITRGVNANIVDHADSTIIKASYNAREGEVVTVTLQHRGFGAGTQSEIQRMRISMDPLDGTEIVV